MWSHRGRMLALRAKGLWFVHIYNQVTFFYYMIQCLPSFFNYFWPIAIDPQHPRRSSLQQSGQRLSPVGTTEIVWNCWICLVCHHFYLHHDGERADHGSLRLLLLISRSLYHISSHRQVHAYVIRHCVSFLMIFDYFFRNMSFFFTNFYLEVLKVKDRMIKLKILCYITPVNFVP